MIVPPERAVVARRFRTEPYFGDVPFVLKISKRIVDGRERNAGQDTPRILENLVRRQVFVRLAYHPQNRLTLFCKAKTSRFLHRRCLRSIYCLGLIWSDSN